MLHVTVWGKPAAPAMSRSWEARVPQDVTSASDQPLNVNRLLFGTLPISPLMLPLPLTAPGAL